MLLEEVKRKWLRTVLFLTHFKVRLDDVLFDIGKQELTVIVQTVSEDFEFGQQLTDFALLRVFIHIT